MRWNKLTISLDIAFYGLGLNSSTILQTIGFGSVTAGTPQHQIQQSLRNVSIGNIILAVGGLVGCPAPSSYTDVQIPGYWLTFAFIDFWGRKPIQLMGFIILVSGPPSLLAFAFPDSSDHHLHLHGFRLREDAVNTRWQERVCGMFTPCSQDLADISVPLLHGQLVPK